MIVKDIYSYIDIIAPFSTQAEWDNSGLIAGDLNADVKRAVICLDVTQSEIQLAAKMGAALIISHHPLIFNAQKTILSDSVCYAVAKNNLSVISAHTNLDKAVGGVNDLLCNKLNMNYYKAPVSVADGFLNIGSIDGVSSAQELALKIGNSLNAYVRFCDSNQKIDKIAVCSGAGADLIFDAAKAGCNAFITGDASYHQFVNALELNMSLFAAGHFETENLVSYGLKTILSKQFNDVEFIVSQRQNPIITVK